MQANWVYISCFANEDVPMPTRHAEVDPSENCEQNATTVAHQHGYVPIVKSRSRNASKVPLLLPQGFTQSPHSYGSMVRPKKYDLSLKTRELRAAVDSETCQDARVATVPPIQTPKATKTQ